MQPIEYYYENKPAPSGGSPYEDNQQWDDFIQEIITPQRESILECLTN